ncbi:MAG: bifunctional (p)ppGpp synthetase/guanosine-3',5'-bis(diphosphate) 3'-pyrophosphohydrolase, partial [Clostridia bacterium]|nr:bifunctional (p)ppGpp synthetase/guanosine-3',5'-bis(diphosphate) 3'-pyrophosphohydrolase [Clostridia bacterium]
MTLEQMLERVRKYEFGESGCDLISRAWHFAEKAHEGQKRQSGEPYFVHPNYVASILTELMIDPPTIAASLLHDTVEDCEGVTRDTIVQNFGEEVA